MSTSLRYTSSDLELLPKIDGVRYEIIDGDLYVSTATDWRHQHTCGKIWASLIDWSDRSGAGIPILAPGIVFPNDENAIPDVVWIRRERLGSIFDEAGHLKAAPDLVVEVLSPGANNEKRDRDVKLKLYSRQGAREYWIVDWRERTILVFRRVNAQLELAATLMDEDTLTSPLLPDFACPISTLWPPAV